MTLDTNISFSMPETVIITVSVGPGLGTTYAATTVTWNTNQMKLVAVVSPTGSQPIPGGVSWPPIPITPMTPGIYELRMCKKGLFNFPVILATALNVEDPEDVDSDERNVPVTFRICTAGMKDKAKKTVKRKAKAKKPRRGRRKA